MWCFLNCGLDCQNSGAFQQPVNWGMKRSEARSKIRKEAVEAIIVQQEPAHLAARIYNIPYRTVFDWLSRYRSSGRDALKEGHRSGRKRKLLAEDMQWVYGAATMGNPMNYRFEFCLWIVNFIRETIARERGIKLGKASVSRLLGYLGMSP